MMLVWTYVSERASWVAYGWTGYYQIKIGGRIQFIQPGKDPLKITDLGECDREAMEEAKECCEIHHRNWLLNRSPDAEPEAPPLSWIAFQSGRVYRAVGFNGYYELTIGDRARYALYTGPGVDLYDLGECTQENLPFCMRVCHEHNRILMMNAKKKDQSSS